VTALTPPEVKDLLPGLPERFCAKTSVEDAGHETPCVVWTGAKQRDGYGTFQMDGKSSLAHRVSYEALVGQVPTGLELDHLCRVRACVRPDHLEPVTTRVNVLRGEGPTAVNAAKTHCPQGHPYSPENTRKRPCGRRMCRTCDRARKREWKRKQRASA
jgi:hypothetical protein